MLLEKKNDLKAAVNFVQAGTVLGFTRSTKDSRGIDLQGAYAITDKAGLKINAYTKQKKSGGVVFYQKILFEGKRVLLEIVRFLSVQVGFVIIFGHQTRILPGGCDDQTDHADHEKAVKNGDACTPRQFHSLKF